MGLEINVIGILFDLENNSKKVDLEKHPGGLPWIFTLELEYYCGFLLGLDHHP